MRLFTAMLCLTVALPGCARDARDDGVLTLAQPRALTPPAGPGAAQPFAASWGDDVLLSWTEPADGGHALRFAVWDGIAWTEPRTVARGSDWFVNWADFPSVLADEQLVAHWLQRSGPGRYSYDVMLTHSSDGGATWSPPVRPHRDGTESEHGFVSLFPHDGATGVIWLDGRRFVDGPDGPATREMMLLSTTYGAAGLGDEVAIDDRVCECCQTAVASAARGPVVVYRDRSPEEVRDIAVSRFIDGTWSAPRRVHADNWVINACPVNGPAIDARDDDVVVGWFTAADETPRVRIAFSSDGGASFDAPVTIDDGHPVGRVDVLFVADRQALVVWLERIGEDAEIRGRLVRSDGRTGSSASLASTTAGRAGGFPRMARRPGQVLLSWTEPGEPSSVRAAVIDLPR
jgi:hypothetical protein